MPTPFKNQSGEWSAPADGPRRSVFANYRADTGKQDTFSLGEGDGGDFEAGAGPGDATLLQSAIDLAVARSFVHRFLAHAYTDPTREGWSWLCSRATWQNLLLALKAVKVEEPAPVFIEDAFEEFRDAYTAAFGHAARGSCPLNEIEYGDIKADPLFQPHRLADLAAFYRAFGLEVAEDAGERQDHISLELEFLCVLAAKEAYALEHQLDSDCLAQCRNAQKKFLREHPGRWLPAFSRRLAAATQQPALCELAVLTRRFIESECARFGVEPGSGELGLRPVDEGAERLCETCGVK